MSGKFSVFEIDFIEFIAQRFNEIPGKIEKEYLSLRNRFAGFRGKRFRQVTTDIQTIFGFFNNPNTEEETLDAYRSLSSIHLLIYLLSSFPKRFSERVQSGIDLLKNKQYGGIFQFGRRYLKSNIITKGLEELLIENISGDPVIVDYGSGIAQLSLSIARKIPAAKIYLVDVDMMVLDFAVFRFRKYGCNFDVIRITNENLYPSLPEHNLCIANEVMEHVYEPLRVYQNINNSMTVGGILYGNFADHSKDMLHVSPNLSGLRKMIEQDYETIETKTYKKVR